jgi:hypothetical protein
MGENNSIQSSSEDSRRLELETGLGMSTHFIHIPELGPSQGIHLEMPVILCHPQTLKPLITSGIKDGNGQELFRCEQTGTVGGFPAEIWKFVLPRFPQLMKTISQNGALVRVPSFNPLTRFKITFELLSDGESSSETDPFPVPTLKE